MELNVYLTGVGGQGVLTIAELLMNACLKHGIPCNYFPTKGMAQRGGFVKAQLRIGGRGDAGPDIRKGGADVVIAMELSESLRAIDYLKPEGDMVVYTYKWLPTEAMLGRAHYPSVEQVEIEAKKRTSKLTFVDVASLPKGGADNIYLMAKAIKHTRINELFPAEDMLEVINARFPKGKERNEASYKAGLEA